MAWKGSSSLSESELVNGVLIVLKPMLSRPPGGLLFPVASDVLKGLRNTKRIFLRIMENLLFEPNWSFPQGQESPRRPKKVS